ncbi:MULTISPECIES: FixH family protein [unclassified Variovorax]|uniref:FixH family protein n=1 Tax=unclassified Variovorax TaxID=663243 RepID=UPI002109C879|nr:MULTISPECIES: FixH family protein [unclassified Variovorax]
MTAYEQASAPPPWWRYPLVWLVIGLPAAVIVASLASAWLAMHTTDTVVEEDYYRKGIEINRTLADKSPVPAQMGRNHAMTPAEDVPVRPKAKP